MSLRRIVGALRIADRAHDDLARVEAHPHGKGEAARAANLFAEDAQPIAQVEGGLTGALGVIFVRERDAEQRHDAIAGVLIDRPLEPVHALIEDLKEPIQHPMPLLGADLLGELHRIADVDEQDRDLLALAERRRWLPRLSGCSLRHGCERLPTLGAKFRPVSVEVTARGALHRDVQRLRTIARWVGAVDLRSLSIRAPAGWIQNMATISPPSACASRRLNAGSKMNCASGCKTSHGAMAI